jgi:amidase/6-aminohexanoate-cyclic-dimer hydrolase
MSDFAEYDDMDALELAARVRRRELAGGDVLDAALARIARIDPQIRAVCLLAADAARAAIRAGLPEGPFAGVPLLLKDITAAARGLPMTCGSRFFTGTGGEHDTALVERYRRAGFVLLGRTTTPEMAISPTTEAAVYGAPTRNPWRLEHSAGGSSGGAGAAVAARLVPLAHGSDGGGSIRIPASCNGVFGFKPTRARLPTGPDAGEGWAGLLTEHVLTRSVRDSAAALDATHGADPGAYYVAPPVARPYLREIETPPARLRIAFTAHRFDGGFVDPQCRAAVDSAARLCASLGHEVEEAAPGGFDWHALLGNIVTVMASGSALAVRERSRALGRAPREDELEPATRGAVRHAEAIRGPDYLAALAALHRFARAVAPFFDRYDALLTPVLATPPAPLGRWAMTNPDFVDYRLGPDGLLNYVAFTPLANVTGQPAMSVPLHWSAEGLPIGAHFVGRFGDEATLFKLARQLEQAAPWKDRRPGLSAR